MVILYTPKTVKNFDCAYCNSLTSLEGVTKNIGGEIISPDHLNKTISESKMCKDFVNMILLGENLKAKSLLKNILKEKCKQRILEVLK